MRFLTRGEWLVVKTRKHDEKGKKKKQKKRRVKLVWRKEKEREKGREKHTEKRKRNWSGQVACEGGKRKGA